MVDVRAELWNEDCIRGMAARLADNSVHLTVTSPPFEDLFVYSGAVEDVGNNPGAIDPRTGRFALNLRFVIHQLYRVTAPGCNACVHVQQLIAHKNQHGYMGRRDFRGAIIELFTAAQPGGAFRFTGEFVIKKDQRRMAKKTKLHSLQFKSGYARTSTMWAPAVNDYVLIFQKPGEIAVPVRPLKHASNPNGWMTREEWIRDAAGVWTDIMEIDVIDGARSPKQLDRLKEAKEERHVCLARGSLVLTRNGHVPIEEVKVGDQVLTHLGRWRPVTATVCNGTRPVVRLTAQGVADLRLTPDHKLWVRSGTGPGGGRWATGGVSHPRVNATRSVPGWMAAEATKGSYINLPLPPIEDSPLSKDDWWIIGRWLGDGHFDSRGRAHISCSAKEAPSLIAAMGARAGFHRQIAGVIQIDVKDSATVRGVAGGRRATAFTAMLRKCGRGAAGKRLPAEALALDPIKAEALLSGYLSADGHFVEKLQRWSASSVSRPLLLGMAMVAQRARGVIASVYAGRPARTCTIQGRQVNTRQDWILGIPPRNISGLLLDDGAWKKVRTVEAAGDAEVWDIQVADDESFTAEGCVVHNCPLQLEVVRRCVRLYSNPISIQPDVTVLDPFSGIATVQYVALGGASRATGLRVEEPRNAVGFELKKSYHRQGLANIQRALKCEPVVRERVMF